jgi:hypothetical protein
LLLSFLKVLFKLDDKSLKDGRARDEKSISGANKEDALQFALAACRTPDGICTCLRQQAVALSQPNAPNFDAKYQRFVKVLQGGTGVKGPQAELA